MRRFAIPILAILALLTLGAVFIGDRFVVRISQWTGQSSDELYSDDLGQVADMCNFEVRAEGEKTYLQQRRGIRRFTAFLPAGIYAYAVGIYAPRGQTQHLIVAGSDGKFYSTSGLKNEATDWDTVRAVPMRQYTNFAQFKDTLIAPCADSVVLIVANGASSLKRAASYSYQYGRVFVHQDRVYGYNVAYASSANDHKLCWMPEFDLRFNLLDTAIGSGYVYIGRDDADFLTNVLPLGQHLVAYKSHTIYNVLIGSETNKPEQIVKVTDNIGAICYNSACSYNNVHYFVSADGVYRYDGSSVTKISAALDGWFADSIQVIKTVENSTVRIQAVNNRLYVSLPVRNPAQHTLHTGYRLFVCDLNTGIWWKMIPNPCPTNGVYELLRYDYPDGVNAPLQETSGDFRYRSSLMMYYDSSYTGNFKGAVYAFPGDIALGTKLFQDPGGRITATYTTALSPIKEMWSRKQLERATVFGSGVAACTTKIDWYGDANTIIDSSKFALTATPKAVTKRLPPTISGQMLKFRLRITDTCEVKINALEIVGSVKGLANDN